MSWQLSNRSISTFNTIQYNIQYFSDDMVAQRCQPGTTDICKTVTIHHLWSAKKIFINCQHHYKVHYKVEYRHKAWIMISETGDNMRIFRTAWNNHVIPTWPGEQFLYARRPLGKSRGRHGRQKSAPFKNISWIRKDCKSEKIWKAYA